MKSTLRRDATIAATRHGVMEHLRELAPNARLRADVRFTDNGKILTTGGISAGIDGSLHVVARLHGLDVARATLRYMEYDWTPQRTYGEPAIPHAGPDVPHEDRRPQRRERKQR